MQKGNIIVGIDIGSSNVCTVIAQSLSDAEFPRVIGVGIAPAAGIRKGMIIDVEEATKSIIESVEKGERMAGVTVKRATVSVCGTEIAFQESKGVVAIGRADGEVTEDDIDRVIKDAQHVSIPLNREIIHLIPKNYRLDDQDNLKDPLGMKGVRLEVNALVIEGSSTQMKNLKKAVEQAGIEVEDVILEPLATAKSVLDKKQRELGVVVVNIGGATTSLAVFEEGDLLHTAIIPVGAGHVTNDVAICIRTSIEVAEKIKLEYGSALAKEFSKREEIDLTAVDSRESGAVSRYHVAEIIEARMTEIFGMLNKELKRIGKAELLPAGVVLTGGGAKLPQVVELAKDIFRLPVQIGYPVKLGGVMDKVDDPSFSTVVGLIMWEKEKESLTQGSGMLQGASGWLREGYKKMEHLIGKFLPS
ncbi:cell division protein FtsA [Patescibacteria group bacterium]|nr:MAG: cell division protein FtsA [Patescibacteria group bacterium]